ncbi:MAG TPA: hypothetical protein VGB04_09905 [Allosphingosinicella sp.]
MTSFFDGLRLETLVGFGTAALILITYLIDRYGWFAPRKKALHVTGTWQGWSVFRPVELRRKSYHSDDEHYFQVTVDLKQRFGRVRFRETIHAVYRRDGSKVENVPERRFTGSGQVIGGVNLGIIFDEDEGLTCGAMFLTMDTWGKELAGATVVRNVDGKPVLADVVLWRFPKTPAALQALLEQDRGPQALAHSGAS